MKYFFIFVNLPLRILTAYLVAFFVFSGVVFFRRATISIIITAFVVIIITIIIIIIIIVIIIINYYYIDCTDEEIRCRMSQ